MATRRQRRVDKKYKSHLLCESCNRWTTVPMDVWRDAIKAQRERHKQVICLCARAACKNSRPEGLLSPLNDKQREEVIYA